MIYGDQSQEGFLLRDYFCCDTNELRLQIHCRPITLEKRLLAYYAQIISRFYPPCYSLQHLILLCANVYFRAHMRVFVCTAFQMDSGLLSVKPCCLHWGAPACWFITAALCCQSSSLSCIFWCTNMPPMHVSHCDQALAWGICDWRGTLRRGKRRWEEREGSESLCGDLLSDWVIPDSTVSTLHKELQENREGACGDLLMYIVLGFECACMCVSAYDAP